MPKRKSTIHYDFNLNSGRSTYILFITRIGSNARCTQLFGTIPKLADFINMLITNKVLYRANSDSINASRQ